MTAAAGFTGDHDIYAGEIAGVRTFVLRSDGTLWPVSHADRQWVDGENVAQCTKHDRAGAPRCGCGFWSYGTAAAAEEQPTSRHVLAIVDNWGRITPGTRGVRAQYATIRAVWLSARVTDGLRDRVAARYPATEVFRDRDTMLLRYPPTMRARYQPDVLGRRRSARALRWLIPAQAVVALLVATLTGLLAAADPSERPSTAFSPTPGVVVLFAVITLLLPLARGVLVDREGRRATALVRRLNANAIIGLVALAVLSGYAQSWQMRTALLLPWVTYLVWRWLRPFPPPLRRTLGGILTRAVSSGHRQALAHT